MLSAFANQATGSRKRLSRSTPAESTGVNQHVQRGFPGCFLHDAFKFVLECLLIGGCTVPRTSPCGRANNHLDELASRSSKLWKAREPSQLSGDCCEGTTTLCTFPSASGVDPRASCTSPSNRHLNGATHATNRSQTKPNQPAHSINQLISQLRSDPV